MRLKDVKNVHHFMTDSNDVNWFGDLFKMSGFQKKEVIVECLDQLLQLDFHGLRVMAYTDMDLNFGVLFNAYNIIKGNDYYRIGDVMTFTHEQINGGSITVKSNNEVIVRIDLKQLEVMLTFVSEEEDFHLNDNVLH